MVGSTGDKCIFSLNSKVINFYRIMDLLDSNKYLWDDFREKHLSGNSS